MTGVEATLPRAPGLFTVNVPPEMSSVPSCLARARFTRSSILRARPTMFSSSAPRMTGTIRAPSSRSTATPTLTCLRSTILSPSHTELRTGCSLRASTAALTMNGRYVSLTPSRSAKAAFSFSRSAARPVMSTSTSVQACGISALLTAMRFAIVRRMLVSSTTRSPSWTATRSVSVAAAAGTVSRSVARPSIKLSMSFLVTRPPVPVPEISEMSTSCSSASLLTTGEERRNLSVSASSSVPWPLPALRQPRASATARCFSPFCTAGWASVSATGHSSVRASSATSSLGVASAEGDSSPSTATSTISVPTSTVVPSETRSFSILPATGEGSSALTLSVSTSARGSSFSTSSPSALSQRVIVPSVTLSPRWGLVTGVATSPPPVLLLDRPRGDVGGHAGRDRVVAVAVFVETDDSETRLNLPADLIFQRVAELERLAPLDLPRHVFFALARRVRVGECIPHAQLAAVIHELQVEDIDSGVEEPGQKIPPTAQHAERLHPHRAYLGGEEVRDGVEDEVEALVRKQREVSHIPLDRSQVEPLALGDQAVLCQLPRRVVQHGDVRARRREYRGLLPAARSEAEDIRALEVREPVLRDRFGLREQDLPPALTGGLDDVGADRDGPLVAALDLSVPGFPVVVPDAHLVAGKLEHRRLYLLLTRDEEVHHRLGERRSRDVRRPEAHDGSVEPLERLPRDDGRDLPGYRSRQVRLRDDQELASLFRRVEYCLPVQRVER